MSDPVPGPTPLTPAQVELFVRAYAMELQRKGVPFPEIEEHLIAKGFDPDTAGIVVGELKREERARSLRKSGILNMICGGLISVGGLGVTIGTLVAAEAGGSYVIAWGAILCGGAQFLYGLMQANNIA
jgi:hypothetical protein